MGAARSGGYPLRMIVAIHQPHFLPWLGYFDRMRKADLFILLDHVQFERSNFQNRVKVKSNHGTLWLTVPVQRGSQTDSILDKKVLDGWDGKSSWGERSFLSLRIPYARAPFFERYAARVQELLKTSWKRLVDLDLATIEFLRGELGIRTPMLRSSQLAVPGQKADLIFNLCKAVGADAFLAGLGGSRRYIDADAFARAGIRVLYQEFAHPAYRQQPNPESFVPGLSTLDLLFNEGPRAAEMLAQLAQPQAAQTG